VLALACPLATHAQNGPVIELTPEHFSQLDRNKSGGISKDEYDQFMRESFRKLDTDHSNTISKAEAAKVLSPEQFAQVDKNGDGEISLDEFIEHVMKDFERWDRNKDGELQP
jgi:Ca2+-binding EF-hand superfamily protein